MTSSLVLRKADLFGDVGRKVIDSLVSKLKPFFHLPLMTVQCF